MKTILNILNDFLNLIYPNVCIICDEKLVIGEKMFCSRCLSDIPKTNITDIKNNQVAEIFWGRIQLEGAISLFYFKSGSRYRKLLHKLKYQGEKEIGIELGKMTGNIISQNHLALVDCIVPIPLHSSRLRSRGYNQSELIATGISMIINKPVVSDALVRKVFNVSQTGMGRYDRWQNVEGIFKVIKPEVFVDHHVLLVDDIITTGSTIEACVTEIHKQTNSRISVCSVAVTR